MTQSKKSKFTTSSRLWRSWIDTRFYQRCHNPNLGLATKEGACKKARQEGDPRGISYTLGSVGKCERMNSHTPKATPTWGVESRRTPKFSRSNCRGQNPLVWRVLYIIGKILKLRCLKLDHITHLDIWITSYGQKKGRKSNWQFNSQPRKVGNWPDFLACRWRET